MSFLHWFFMIYVFEDRPFVERYLQPNDPLEIILSIILRLLILAGIGGGIFLFTTV